MVIKHLKKNILINIFDSDLDEINNYLRLKIRVVSVAKFLSTKSPLNLCSCVVNSQRLFCSQKSGAKCSY